MSHFFSPSPALASDIVAIDHLLDLSFGPARRIKTSYRLREGAVAVDGLSWVVRDDELDVVGAISFWPLAIGAKSVPALLLGPLAVHPSRQNMGIGLSLMTHTLELAKLQGHKLVILVGDAPYYARVGFSNMPKGQLLLPGPFDEARLLYLELMAGALAAAQGLVVAAHRFR